MPTYEARESFRRDFEHLTKQQQEAFLRAVDKLVIDLRRGVFRKGLRIKRFESHPDTWEMTWADDGRALFAYGPSKRPGDPHIIWLRVGGHEIFEG
jgi:hypothetical protein